ncbi:VanZ family protein [Intrasporangium sp.]|uniref:VanZ family protein n=1 Tax=Intrasporangium sp. TaxID=1925024 RepID=UPI00293A711E|nr:VanZ family protein [Intrasporangium sp.]MDV3222283.1 VanZ family protein [Intrasporangium sp.]
MVAGARRWWVATAVLSLTVHLLALYWPVVTVAGPVSWTDKAVHVLVFAIPTYAVGMVVARLWWAVTGFAAHALVSELSQHLLLPGRSGDPWDVVADLAGVALAAVALVVSRRVARW